MDRRSFCESALALPVSPALLGKSLGPDWETIVGGNRVGKSTIAANECRRYSRPHIMGRSYQHTNDLKYGFGLAHAVSLSSCLLEEHIEDDDIRGDILWVDESLYFYDFCDLARKFRRVIWTTWPYPEVADDAFYLECKRMGRVRHMKAPIDIRSLV